MSDWKRIGLVMVTALAPWACDDGGGGGPPAGDAARGDGAPADGGPPDGHVDPDGGPAPDGGCPPGSLGCPCAPGEACGGGNLCRAGRCVPPEDRPLGVSDPAARSCEVYMRADDGTAILGARFGAGVRGRLLRQPPAAALAFIREADAPFPEGSVRLQIEGPADGLAIASTTCFDADGRPLPGAEVVLR